MKKILLLISLSNICFAQCPVEGQGRNAKEKTLNTQKNRDIVLLKPTIVSLNSILKSGNDENRFTTNMYIETEGYLILKKMGGKESCNCHGDKTSWDIHLEISLNPTDKGNQSMICEITPKYLGRDSIDFKSMIGKKVTIKGYLFFDLEHKQNATNTNPTGTNLWRGTCWEVHPVCEIKLIN